MTPKRQQQARAYAAPGRSALVWQSYSNEALDEIERLQRELAAAKAELAEYIARGRPGPSEAEEPPMRARRRR